MRTQFVKSIVCVGVLLVTTFVARGKNRSDDYLCDNIPSRIAKAYFEAAPTNLTGKAIRRGETDVDGNGARYTADGGIVIPPHAMIVFKNAGKCMDPHLPAPAYGEPIQLIDTDRLINAKLRNCYNELMERAAAKDPVVLANNLQHLVWALRTVGTDDPMANNLSNSQLELLDDCIGRRNGFIKIHEKEKAGNARNKHQKKRLDSTNRISVGDLSYDASELCGTNGVQLVESHIETLSEMGKNAQVKCKEDFRYGEIGEGLYSDIICNGGLSFTARILNASDSTRIFHPEEFAAQVGNGAIDGSRRQRITISPPDVVYVIPDCKYDVDMPEIGIEDKDEDVPRERKPSRKPRKASKEPKESSTPLTPPTGGADLVDKPTPPEQPEAPAPVEPPTPPEPVYDTMVITQTIIKVVTNQVTTVVRDDECKIYVVSLKYDVVTQKGVLSVEVVKGSFRRVNEYIRQHLDRLVRIESSMEESSKIPSDSRLVIDSIKMVDSKYCEVMFRAECMIMPVDGVTTRSEDI